MIMARRKSRYRQDIAKENAVAEPPPCFNGWLQTVADCLRTQYYINFEMFGNPKTGCLPEWRSGPQDEAEQQLWRRLATEIVVRLVEHNGFILAQFHDGPAIAQCVPTSPSQLFARWCFERYDVYLRSEHLRRTIESTLHSYKSIAHVHMVQRLHAYDRGAEAAESVASDPSLQFTPLFRYYLARGAAEYFAEDRADLDKLAARYEIPAAIMYVPYRAIYDKTWLGQQLPADFRKQANKIYRHAFA
jgi:hypothetical protein